MVLYNAVGAVRDFGLSSDDDLPLGLIVNSSGSIFFSQPTTIRSACALNVADFPFDDQTCQLTFGSWTMDSSLVILDLRKEGIDMTQFVKNSKWDVLQISPEVRMHDNFQDNDFSLVVYTIMVRRKSLFFIVNYLIPSVVILALSLLLFLIPPEVGKRMEAGINLLLCLSVYLLLLNTKMPNASKNFPLLTKFSGCAIIILALAMCCTCLVYAVYFMNSSGVELHHTSLFILFKNFILQRLQPLLFTSPCRRLKRTRSRARSKVHPSQTVDLDLTPDFDARKDKTPEECHKDDGQAHSIQDPPLIITSDSHGTIPRISAAGRVDQEGRLTLVSVGSSFEYSSSVSSTASVRSDENVKAVMATYNESIAAEFVRSESLTEDCKKVSFACEKSESRKVVKRRATKIHDGESAVKRTEHTLVCSAGSSWFTQVSWDESLDDNGNDIEDISGRLQEGVDQLRGFNSGSDTKDSDVDDITTAIDGLDYIAEYFERENTQRANTEQWKRAAMVLDRVFLIIFFTAIVVSLLTCLLLAARVRKYFIS